MTPEAMAQCRHILEQMAETLVTQGMNRADVATLFVVVATKLTVRASGAAQTAEILRNAVADLIALNATSRATVN
jgi:hypothetical protein